MDEETEERQLLSKSVQLGKNQWRWLDAKAARTYRKSASDELRKIIDAAMEAETKEAAATA